MKTKNILCLLMVFMGATLFGCKSFLDETVYSNIGASNFWKNKDDALSGLYSTYTLSLSFGPRDCRPFFLLTDMTTDDMDSEYSNTENERREIQTFNFQDKNKYFNDAWVSLYKTIAQANVVIERVPKIESLSEQDKGYIVGEARFLRALEYFYLVQLWGDVPLDTVEVATIVDTQMPKSTKTEIYNTILNDLKFAETHCSDAPQVVGRATKWAAKALLAKVYLTLAGPFSNRNVEMLQLAEGKLKEVMGSERYSLVPKIKDYFDISKKNNTETIYDHHTLGDVSERVGSFMHRNFYPSSISDPAITSLKTAGYKAWTPTPDLWSLYLADDDRLKEYYTVHYIKKNSNGTFGVQKYNVPYIKKYTDSTTVARDYKANNLPVIRYADVLLMYSEVLNELGIAGPKGDRYYYLNLVRKRAFSKNPTANEISGTHSKEDFRELVMRERRLEFAHEGQRLFDMKRTGTYISKMTDLANKVNAALASSPVPTYSGTYPGGIYPNPAGNTPYNAGTVTFTADFLKNTKRTIPKPYQLVYPIPYAQLQAFDIGQNEGYPR
ncbi:RagB/SusD family nutrient uptake outer membrane protein [Pseudopedobacter saltans]|nr:RagB/SusD family nutrient uptake outer membrane protein [Pseudopedobacter saltans]